MATKLKRGQRPEGQGSLFDVEEIAEVFAEVGILPENPSYKPPYEKDQILEAAFDYYRSIAFPYRKLPLHVCMQELNWLSQMDDEALKNTSVAYHVADTYHPHRLHGHATGKISPFDAFNSDKHLKHALELELEQDGKIGTGLFSSLMIVLGTQACANFRPGYAAHFYRRYCPQGGTVLDTSTGYGGRLVGAIASRVVGKYIGIDPNVPTFEGNVRLARDLAPEGFAHLLCLPAEDVWARIQHYGHMDWLEEACDFAFTSPPYFAKERYSTDNTQSWVRYGGDKTGMAWRTEFLRPMLALQYHALKPESHAVVNIAAVKLNNQRYPLDEWTIEEASRAGFLYLRTEHFGMNQRIGANQEEGVAKEPVLIFRK